MNNTPVTYTKTIFRMATDSIEITVNRIQGKVVTTPLYDIVQGYPFQSDESKFKRAHKIADKAIEIMKRQECFQKPI